MADLEDRRGVLFPGRLPTFAREPAPPRLADRVRWCWVPRWDLPPGEVSRQHLLPFPVGNLVVGPQGVELAGPTTRASHVDLEGTGWAVGALLRPAGLAALHPRPGDVRDMAVPVEAPGLHHDVAAAMALPDEDAGRRRAVAVLLAWSAFYLGANAVAAAAGIALLYPRQRLRLRPRLYLRRAADSLAVAGAEVLFYLQSEMDKILVLSLGGPQIAGVYAMLMRLIDLTALPVRSFNTMAVQKLMRAPAAFSSWRMRWGIEGGIALVSVAGMAGLGLVLLVAPTLLGRNVADAAPLMLVALAVPAFRNLVEYESELLYARGLTGTRAGLLALLGLMKAGLLTLLLASTPGGAGTGWIAGLNGVFATLWLASAMTAYTAMDGSGAAPRLRWRWARARRLPG